MPVCCVATCRSNYEKYEEGIVLHSFPTKPALAKVWYSLCHRKYNLIQLQRPSDRICSKHFTDNDYKRDLMNELLNLPIRKRRQLKPGAIPSLYLPSEPITELRSRRSMGKEVRQRQISGKAKSQASSKLIKEDTYQRYHKSRGIRRLRPELLVETVLKQEKNSDLIEESGDVVIDISKRNMKILNYFERVPEHKITHLILNDNRIENLPTISCFEGLTKLSLANNNVSDLGWFTLIPNLKVLDAPNNKISSISSLTHLRQLTHLNVSRNLITSLKGYEPKSKSNLEYLDLSYNEIEDIICFKPLVKLKVLKLAGNRIRFLQNWGFIFLPSSLKQLELANNLLVSLLDFRYLADLESLETISVKCNPCIYEPLHTVQNSLSAVDLLLKDNSGRSTITPFAYKSFLLALCPKLKTINDGAVSEAERGAAHMLKTDNKLNGFDESSIREFVEYLSRMCPSLIVEKLSSKITSVSPVKIPCQKVVTEKEPPSSLNFKVVNSLVYGPKVTSPLSKDQFQEVLIAVPILDDNHVEGVANNNGPINLPVLDFPVPVPKINVVDSHIQPQITHIVESPLQPPINKETEDCNSSCSHYIHLAEEKAKNHLYKRLIDDLMEKVQLLAARNQQIVDKNLELGKIILQNDLTRDVKFECEEEELW